ncbi:MAG: MFS transporter [Chitinophagaceae bacterium]
MSNKISKYFNPLKNKGFAQLYFAQTISLLGDAFTWVGIALLAYDLGGNNAATILATALTLRVTAFIVFGPYAGVLADNFDRKRILYITHFARMLIVGCLPFITQEWQLYLLIFSLNIFNAFFTPAYKAALPQLVKQKEDYAIAISLSNATWQLLGVLGPGLAGILAVWLGAREIFFLDAASFIIAAVLIIFIPKSLLSIPENANKLRLSVWADIKKGTRLLYNDTYIRFALLIELAAAIAGAVVLVNTITYIKAGLHLSSKEYGWVMMAFGIGATIAAFLSGILDKTKSKKRLLLTGVLMLAGSISIANYVGFYPLLILWLIAGLGQSFAEMPSQILIAENINREEHGKVYGAHFAWSHLWWAIGYPIAGFLGTRFQNKEFLYGGIISFILVVLISGVLRINKSTFKFNNKQT